MTLYWPDQKVALVIVDDPSSERFAEEACSDWTVVHTTCEQVDSPEGFVDVFEQVAVALDEGPVGCW